MERIQVPHPNEKSSNLHSSTKVTNEGSPRSSTTHGPAALVSTTVQPVAAHGQQHHPSRKQLIRDHRPASSSRSNSSKGSNKSFTVQQAVKHGDWRSRKAVARCGGEWNMTVHHVELLDNNPLMGSGNHNTWISRFLWSSPRTSILHELHTIQKHPRYSKNFHHLLSWKEETTKVKQGKWRTLLVLVWIEEGWKKLGTPDNHLLN
ncbi:hypothetical protein LR48_Vigan11g138700 [Vigna angularis]|uniref:Uncharacterized protein n=1 Tax=Phaseolus angularis TaxID=3914 RepID=A0A0L9VTT6_PHAAN|nr:hypothetical protein LR48_Vigan11g138700 [Vigna angularis]